MSFGFQLPHQSTDAPDSTASRNPHNGTTSDPHPSLGLPLWCPPSSPTPVQPTLVLTNTPEQVPTVTILGSATGDLLGPTTGPTTLVKGSEGRPDTPRTRHYKEKERITTKATHIPSQVSDRFGNFRGKNSEPVRLGTGSGIEFRSVRENSLFFGAESLSFDRQVSVSATNPVLCPG